MIIKIVNFNIHKGKGWHNLKSTLKELDHQIREQKPDLLFFQEIRGMQAEHLVLDKWPHYSFGKNVVHSKGDYGNAILSKFPIIFSENFDLSAHRFERRGLLHSVAILPNQSCLHLLCVHLGLFKRGRKMQFEKIATHIKSEISHSEAIILAGDFNDWTSHATSYLVHELGLQEAFLALQGSYAKTFPAWKPFLKLDRVYSRGFEILQAKALTQPSWRFLSDHIGLEVILRR